MTTSGDLRSRLVGKRLIGFDVPDRDDADCADGPRGGAKLSGKMGGKPRLTSKLAVKPDER